MRNERIDIELIVGSSTMTLTLTDFDIDCAAEVVQATVGNILNVVQRDRREDNKDKMEYEEAHRIVRPQTTPGLLRSRP